MVDTLPPLKQFPNDFSPISDVSDVDVILVSDTDGAPKKAPLNILKGADGREVEIQVNNGEIQWRLVGASTWNTIVALANLVGPAGPTIELSVVSDWICWRVVGGDTWIQLIALTDITGPIGPDGQYAQLQVANGRIQRKLQNATVWTNLISVASLIGPTGNDGPSIELQVASGYIQRRIMGTQTWTNLIALAALKGADGTDGIDGKSFTPRGEYLPSIMYYKNDVVSYNGSSFIVLQATLQGVTPTPDNINYQLNAQKGNDGSGVGDMLKSTYDIDNNGIVDNAEKLQGYAALGLPVSNPTQTALNEKVATADIVDNLTSQDADKPLSAKQGKVLADSIAQAIEQGVNRGTVINAITSQGTSRQLATATVATSDTGFSVGDIVYLQSDKATYTAWVIVTTIDGSGAITGVSISSKGLFSEDASGVLSGKSQVGKNATFNCTTTQQANSLLSDITNPKPGDYAYVLQNELSNNESWRRDWADRNGDTVYNWVPIIQINEIPRDFTVDPISNPELENGAVDTSKLSSTLQTLLSYLDISSSLTTLLSQKENSLPGALSKTTPIDNDSIYLRDSADSNKSKAITFTNIKSFLKTYFDTLYTTATQVGTLISNALSTITATSIGLGNVDNTSDIAKPISNDTQIALDTKITYTDFNWVTKSGSTVVFNNKEFNCQLSPTNNFSINAGSGLIPGGVYVLKVTVGTVYTVTLGTNVTNMGDVDVTLTANKQTIFVLQATDATSLQLLSSITQG